MILKAWLLNGLFHSAPGYLSIEGDEIAFSLIDTGTFGKKKLDLMVDKEGAFEEISEGQNIEVFRTQRSNANFHSPWYMFMGGGVLKLPNGTHKLSFMQLNRHQSSRYSPASRGAASQTLQVTAGY